ncbi:YiiX/YebB-like N1pC/P60 family cysteine hydrolase [Edwardsiella tarda]|uniref:YiiX/YebB-like N1pC/P60 family cysteine hydrolase n=1 Tax=Edwardsiella tarda TaxID=636 RepID=UPI00083AB34B|nr:YiiX/YebB-like N1pC/P60 family cysteine hydrolase [Edwardsiella tarda]
MDAVTDLRKKYVLNLEKLKPGDIILEHGYKPHSLAIMKITGSHYSHAMLYIGSTIIEATSSGGVFSKVPNRFAVVDINDLKVLRLREEISPEDMETITTTARALTGSSYNKSEAIIAGKKKRPLQKKSNGQFCSRLVAQCYNDAHIKLVDNINYCSPAELEESPLLMKIDDAVKEASEAELAHALAPTIHTKHLKSSVDWVKAAKKILRKSGVEAETINDIYHATLRLRNPKVDKLILKEIKSSGHYSFYLEDKNVNPFRYDVSKFSDKIGDDILTIDAEIYKEISIVELQSKNLHNSKKYFDVYPSCLMAAEIDLYKGILDITNERLKVIVEHCKNNNLTPELLPAALSMINYIDNI